MERRALMKSVALGVMGTTLVGSGQLAVSASNPAQPPTHEGSFIETNDGTRLFYRDWGSGSPVVFCHPWGLNADIWEYQLNELTEQGLRCVAYDRRGHTAARIGKKLSSRAIKAPRVSGFRRGTSDLFDSSGHF